MQNATSDPTHTSAVEVEARWAPIPESLLYSPEIPAEAVRVYGVLVRYGTQPGNCYPSNGTIAGHIGRSARSVNTWLRDLEQAGWIRRVSRWRKGDLISSSPPDDDEGWEPTSNGFYVYATQRAVERGVRAGERVPPHAGERAPSTLDSAPKESHTNESHLEGEPRALAVVGTTLYPADFEAFWASYPRRHGRIVGKTTCWRIWQKLKPDQLTDMLICLRNYAPECDSGLTLAKDPERWMRPPVWEAWREPAERSMPMSKTMRSALAVAGSLPDSIDLFGGTR